MATICHLGFLKRFFEQRLGFVGPMCISVQNFVEIGGIVAEI